MRKVISQELIEQLGADNLNSGDSYWWGTNKLSTQKVTPLQSARGAILCRELRTSFAIKKSSEIGWCRELDWSLKDTAMRVRKSTAYHDQLGRTRSRMKTREETVDVMKKAIRLYKAQIGALPGHMNYDPLVKATFPVRTKELAQVLAWLRLRERVKGARRKAREELGVDRTRSFAAMTDRAMAKLYTLRGWNRAGSVDGRLESRLTEWHLDRKELDERVKRNLWANTGKHKQGE